MPIMKIKKATNSPTIKIFVYWWQHFKSQSHQNEVNTTIFSNF